MRYPQRLALHAGNMPTHRYQHGAVFVGARLHISGGAVGGGRMVDDASSVCVLDTAAGKWVGQMDLLDDGDISSISVPSPQRSVSQ